jgi:hemerythrin-like domain-containing protein
MDAIVMLREDHRRVEKLFKEFERGDTAVVADICDALEQHAMLEEQVFYPAVKDAVEEARGTVLESLEEHHVVTALIEELRAMSGDEENYVAKATVLMENVRHHIREEEDELFPDVRSALGRKRLQELAEDMERTRQPA